MIFLSLPLAVSDGVEGLSLGDGKRQKRGWYIDSHCDNVTESCLSISS